MDPTIAQFLTAAFLFAIGLTAFEMQAALKPPYCPECSHCRAELHERRRRQAESREHYARQNGMWDDEDDHRR